MLFFSKKAFFNLQKGCIQAKQPAPKIVFVKDALDEHNRLRRTHGVAYLKLNRQLCSIAQEWAEKIASTGKFEHSNNKYDGQSLGTDFFFGVFF
jgi:uncharacterized protein YkwD